jgi:hypothetical protein
VRLHSHVFLVMVLGSSWHRGVGHFESPACTCWYLSWVVAALVVCVTQFRVTSSQLQSWYRSSCWQAGLGGQGVHCVGLGQRRLD